MVTFTNGSQTRARSNRRPETQQARSSAAQRLVRQRGPRRGQDGHASPGHELGLLATGRSPCSCYLRVCKVCVPSLFWMSFSCPIVARMASSDS